MDIRPFGGWDRCAWLSNGEVEAVVTLEVGPRVLRFGRPGGPNHFAVYERHAGLTGGDDYRSYGGHRLWTAPEIPGITNEPDNQPVALAETDDGLRFSTPIGVAGVAKSMTLAWEEDALVVRHRVENQSSGLRPLAPWAISVMAPGGVCLFPLPEPRDHGDALQPGGPLVLWRYTDLSDPRWEIGRRIARLRQSKEGAAQKVGSFVEQGWAAHTNFNEVFIKSFSAEAGKAYTDFGCNFEIFTRHDMLEVESLGTYQILSPGDSVEHVERWRLVPGAGLPAGDEAYAWLDVRAPARLRTESMGGTGFAVPSLSVLPD
ncbi:MAG: hypothetical protein KIT11_02390 [Fimbriimonadaceae bacterium]|nr:hypothetical protein [Fimbriimonadaceae bacterium]QYK54782.1 MAG: hypothetical protein KF733_07145 [Fimbriimonadaceae bacterium]